MVNIFSRRMVLNMGCKVINGIEVTIAGEISDEELTVYLTQQQAKNTHKIIKATVTVDGDFIDINSIYEAVPFDRIRRITGYLVGSTSRWNDAKRAEERDRIKHGCGNC